jgi:hypothetical protein
VNSLKLRKVCVKTLVINNKIYKMIFFILLIITKILTHTLCNCRLLTYFQSDIYQMMCWYNWFSWWGTLCCSKHVEKWNKHIKHCIELVVNTNRTETRGQQNVRKYGLCPSNSTTFISEIAIRKRTELSKKSKAVPLQARTGPEGFRRLRLPFIKKICKWRW